MSREPSTITTSAAGFFHIPVLGKDVFEVRSGLPADTAVTTSRCILSSLISMAVDGVQNGIDETTAYGMQMLLEMVDGLIGSIEGRV